MHTVESYLSSSGWIEISLRILTSWVLMMLTFGVGMAGIAIVDGTLSVHYLYGVGLFALVTATLLTITYIGISHPNVTVSRFTWAVLLIVIGLGSLFL